MNALLVTSGYPPEHSGSGLRLHQTYSRLSDRHPELRWRVLTRRREEKSGAADLPGPEHVDAIPHPRTSSLAYMPVQAAIEWLDFRRRLGCGVLSNVDVVHSAGFTWLTVFLCREAKARGIPVIRELTSTADTGVGRGLGATFFSAVVRRINRSADLLVAISPRLEREVRESGVERPVWCRPNPVDTNRFRLPDESERDCARGAVLRKKGWSEESVVVLHVGHIVSNKNQLLLVKALRHLPDAFKLVLIGPAHQEDQPYLAAIRKEIVSGGLENRTWIDPTFRSDVETWMRSADVLALPSGREGLGNVMLEALCTGLPVAVTRLPGVTDWIVQPGTNGYLFALSPEDIAEKIQAAAELRARREAIASAAAARFDAATIDEAYWTHMKNLVGPSGRSGTPQNRTG